MPPARSLTGLPAFLLVAAISSSSASAQLVTYFSGADPGAIPGGALTNSDVAASSFDAAAVLLGNNVLNVVDFEAAPVGDFLGLTSADIGVAGLAILPAGASAGSDSSILDTVPDFREGFNTTPGGSKYLKLEENQPGPGVEPAVGVTFEFVDPISAFGAYFVGGDLGVLGAISAIFDNGTVQTISLDIVSGGAAQFWGFTEADPNVTINRITILASPELGINTDAIGIDDVRWVSVPEPSSALLLSLGGALALCRRRRNA